MFFDMDKVSWISKQEIQSQVDSLLFNYEITQRMPVAPPIPVENIIETHLGFTLEYDDLQEILGFDDILGATWLKRKKIVINEKLLGENVGRMCFTCGHEIGHILLHGKYVSEKVDSYSRTYARHEIVCRKQTSKKRGEWQADYFSACLLMPEESVLVAYNNVFGPKPLIIHNKKSCFDRNLPLFDLTWDRVKDFALMVMEQGNFNNVSKEAMRVRLEDLGLLIDNTQNQIKREIGDSIKERIKRKNLESLTIKDIISDEELNRKIAESFEFGQPFWQHAAEEPMKDTYLISGFTIQELQKYPSTKTAGDNILLSDPIDKRRMIFLSLEYRVPLAALDGFGLEDWGEDYKDFMTGKQSAKWIHLTTAAQGFEDPLGISEGWKRKICFKPVEILGSSFRREVIMNTKR